MGWLKKKASTPQAGNLDMPSNDHDRQGHASMREADPYSFQVAHRRLAWMFRTSVGINIALAACVVVAVNAIVEIAPLIGETKLALVRADPNDNRLFRIEPINQEVDGFELQMEDKARRYVRNILAIDSVTHDERMAEVRRMTDKRFWKRFEEKRISSGVIKEALASGLDRSITIETVSRIDSIDDTHKYAVDFIQTDERDGKLVDEQMPRAYLTMTTRPQENVPVDDIYENPLGIVVLDLSVKKRGNL